VKKNLQIILVLLITLLSVQAFGQRKQKEQIQNLPEFDLNYYHFGFVISANTSNLIIELNEEYLSDSSIIAVNHINKPGFNLGMLASLDFNGNWHLRFLPTLSFNEHQITYTSLLENGSTEVIDKDISSTNIDFPLLLKYRANRMNNIAPYVLVGGQFSLDVATKKDVENTEEIIIDNKLFSGSLGIGLDFFLPYFKFGIELKANVGINDLFIDTGSKYSAPINSLRTQSIMLSFTFEG